MSTTIIYKRSSGRRLPPMQIDKRNIFESSSLKEVYMYHIDHVDVDSYIIDPKGLTLGQVQSMVEHVRYLNAIITIMIYKPEFDLPSALLNKKYIKIVTNDRDIPKNFKEISTVNRDSNRVQWPLHVEYWKQDNKEETRKKAKVLSLSSSGCFIQTDPRPSMNAGDQLAMTFNFNNFDFYSKGSLVRISNQPEEKQGIAVEFKEVSVQTRKYIREIIDEKILAQIMDTIK